MTASCLIVTSGLVQITLKMGCTMQLTVYGSPKAKLVQKGPDSNQPGVCLLPRLWSTSAQYATQIESSPCSEMALVCQAIANSLLAGASLCHVFPKAQNPQPLQRLLQGLLGVDVPAYETTMHLIPEAREQTSQAIRLSSLSFWEMSELIVNITKNHS